MDVAALKKYGKPALLVVGGLGAVYVVFKLLGGGSSGTAAAGPTTDPNAAMLSAVTAANQQAGQQAVQLAQLDATTYAQTVQAQSQVGAQAIATLGNLQLGNTQALAAGFSNFVVGTAQEVSSTATAAGTLGAANDRATSQNIAAVGQLLGGAGQLVGAITGTGVAHFSGLPSTGFAALQGGSTGLPLVLLPTNNGVIVR